jgi:serine/threonine-protein kinase
MNVPAGEQLVDELAGAILDGTPVDWAAAESSVEGGAREIVEQLKVLAAVAAVHRDGPALATQPWTHPPAPREKVAAPPERWGHLRIVEQVGRGAFGQVYRAWDTRLDREVALKLLPGGRASDDSAASSTIDEGRLLARVRHPNVVTIYGAERIDDQVGLWMEFVRGHTLEQLLKQGTSFSAAEVAAIGLELCHAVSAVHGAGLLHRDIKAQNVTRAEDGRVVLMDFGTGRELDDNSSSDLTGTPLYLAPEVLRGEPATVRSDIYSLGVLLYHLVSGSYPVRARTMQDMRLAHERQDRIALRSARPDVERRLAAVIERASHPEPDRRYQTADALAAGLAPLAPRSAPHRDRPPWVIRLGLVAAMVLLAFVAGDRTVSPALDARAPLLVGAFTSTTGDRTLEAALQQAIATELEQSPRLSVFPAAKLVETLDRMRRPAATPIDTSIGLEICEREGLKVMVAGSVDTLGDAYIVRMYATHAATRSILAGVYETARSRGEVLEAALSATRQLRRKLGETLASVEVYSTSPPLERVTSQSSDAVRHFTLGKQLYDRERARDALPHFLAAISADPDFAMAHDYAGLAYGYLGEYEQQRQHLETAATLASDSTSQVGRIEREKILADREVHFERLHEAAAHQRALVAMRPDDGRALANLGVMYGMLRAYPQAIETLEGAWRLYPHPRVKWMLADMYSSAGRPDAAAQLLNQNLERPSDWIELAEHLMLAGRETDADAALNEAERRSHQTPGASWAPLALVQADYLRSGGRYREAEGALQQGLDRGGLGGTDRLELASASLLIDWGRRAEAAAHLRRIDVQLARNRLVHGVLTARAGDLTTAQAILRRLEDDARDRRAPRPEARVYQLRAEIALARGRTVEAHENAGRAVRAFETAYALETLARAQEAAGMIAPAITTWTTILERQGERAINDWDAPAFSQVVLGWYSLARLQELAGRVDEARTCYGEFLRRWDRSDPDLPVVVDARARLSRLGQGAQSTPSGRVPKPAT